MQPPPPLRIAKPLLEADYGFSLPGLIDSPGKFCIPSAGIKSHLQAPFSIGLFHSRPNTVFLARSVLPLSRSGSQHSFMRLGVFSSLFFFLYLFFNTRNRLSAMDNES